LNSLRGRDFLDLQRFSAEEILEVLRTARRLKKRPTHAQRRLLAGKSVAMIFQKPSTRTSA